MEHLKAIFIKFILFTAVLSIVYGFIYGVSFVYVLALSVWMTILTYIIGDLLILPRFGNLVATVVDFASLLIGFYLLGLFYLDPPFRYGVSSFLASLLIGVGEIFLHSYLVRNIYDNRREYRSKTTNEFRRKPAFQTEIAEETYPEVNTGLKDKEKKE